MIGVDLNANRPDTSQPKSLFDVTLRSFAMLLNCTSSQGREAADVLIQPDLAEFSYHDLSRVSELVEQGEAAAPIALKRIRRYQGRIVSTRVLCPGCGREFPESDQPTHAYLSASPGCWAVYGEVLSREYQDMRYFAVHGYTVDAYSVQHPGQPERRTIQSLAVHLLSLFAAIELGWEQNMLIKVRKRATAGTEQRFHWLTPPDDPGSVTIQEVYASETPEEHKQIVMKWAHAVWTSWRKHHNQIRSWARELGIDGS